MIVLYIAYTTINYIFICVSSACSIEIPALESGSLPALVIVLFSASTAGPGTKYVFADLIVVFVVQSLRCVRILLTPWTPGSITSWSMLRFMSIE